MTSSNNGMSSFLSELAGEATQTLAAKQVQQIDREAMTQSVSAALQRTFLFFNEFVKHLNALEPTLVRSYVLDAKAQFTPLKWQRGMVESRKQSLADSALYDYVFFQVKMSVPAPVTISRRWEQFEVTRKDLNAFGLKSQIDMHDLWRNRTATPLFHVTLEPELLIQLRFQANYTEGRVELECNNVEGFGLSKGKLTPELLQTSLLEEVGRYLMGRANKMPEVMQLTRDAT